MPDLARQHEPTGHRQPQGRRPSIPIIAQHCAFAPEDPKARRRIVHQQRDAITGHRALSASAKVVGYALLGRMRDNTFCWPSQDKIAEDAAVSTRTVNRALNELVAAGLIIRGRSPGRRSSQYTIPWGRLTGQGDPEGVCEGPAAPVQNLPTGGAATLPNAVRNAPEVADQHCHMWQTKPFTEFPNKESHHQQSARVDKPQPAATTKPVVVKDSIANDQERVARTSVPEIEHDDPRVVKLAKVIRSGVAASSRAEAIQSAILFAEALVAVDADANPEMVREIWTRASATAIAGDAEARRHCQREFSTWLNGMIHELMVCSIDDEADQTDDDPDPAEAEAELRTEAVSSGLCPDEAVEAIQNWRGHKFDRPDAMVAMARLLRDERTATRAEAAARERGDLEAADKAKTDAIKLGRGQPMGARVRIVFARHPWLTGHGRSPREERERLAYAAAITRLGLDRFKEPFRLMDAYVDVDALLEQYCREEERKLARSRGQRR
jgi:hypothetical protein